MTEPQMPAKAKIVIDVAVDGEDVHLTITARPMIATLSIAELLERAAEEIRRGRLDSVHFKPMKD